MTARAHSGDVLALCGGIGGAKLALGLYRVLEAGRLTLVVNTGDDFEHLGLNISPDLDTVLYTLAGLADPERGWGRAQETWEFIAALRQLDGEAWFQLGDRDLAMHVLRTNWLRSGKTLTEFAAHMARQLGISARILPMTDAAVRTIVDTSEGHLPFQHYFVRRRCEPAMRGIRFEGATEARPAPGLVEFIGSQALRAIVICPSNPYLSIDPIVAVPGIAAALGASAAPVVAVSPIIGGQAVKGPTGKIMAELGIAASTRAIAAHYRGLIDGLVIDEDDADDRVQIGVPVLVTRTLMKDIADRERLARNVVDFADTIALQPSAKVGGGGRR
ncbi:MAG: 2-phospho-L-lactate transferase [Rhizobiales bacterium]|nr:2-phospho-L-lactate transferase [Hyphomicrobiales bacterium]